MFSSQPELERLDIMNALFDLVLEKLHHMPIDPNESHRILDIGTGTGIWAIEVGEECPTAEVIGIDISPTMPLTVPPNVKFEVADIEDAWNFSYPFTRIHSRYMAGSIKDWPLLMRQCFNNLEPGGWAEFCDFDIDYYSQDGTLTEHHALRKWLTTAYGAEAVTGRTLRPGKMLQYWMEQNGFHNIQVLRQPLPLGIWPKDKKLKKIGFLNWTQLWEGLSGMSLRLYLDCLGWSAEELELLLVDVRKDLKDRKLHVLFDL